MGDGKSGYSNIPAPKSSLEKVFQKFEELEEKYTEGEEVDSNVENCFDAIRKSITLVKNALDDRDSGGLEVQLIEYNQAVGSLEKFDQAIQVYLKSPSDKNFNTIAEIVGHVQDRIAQRILEDLGHENSTEYLKSFKIQKDDIVREYDKLTVAISSLKNTTDFFAAVVSENTPTVLSSVFTKSEKRYNVYATGWLVITILVLSLLGLWLWDTKSQLLIIIPAFITVLNTSASIWLVIIALLPRAILTLVLLILALSTWKVFRYYTQLSVEARKKKSLAELLPLMLMDTKNDTQLHELRLEFIRRISPLNEPAKKEEKPNRVNVDLRKVTADPIDPGKWDT